MARKITLTFEVNDSVTNEDLQDGVTKLIYEGESELDPDLVIDIQLTRYEDDLPDPE